MTANYCRGAGYVAHRDPYMLVGFFLSFQPYHAASAIDLKAAAKSPLANALHGSHPALNATRFAVLTWHIGRVTKHPIAVLVLSAAADPEGLLGQQQIVVKNNVFARFRSTDASRHPA